MKAPGWRAAMGVAVVAAALPVVLTRHLPLQDYPQHLLFGQVLAKYDDPDWGFCESYLTDLRLRPYVGFYGIAWLLSPWIPVAVTARALLVLYTVGTPLAVLAYTREVAPARAPAALVAVGCVFNVLYYLGHLNFLLALPLCFTGLWAFLRVTSRGSWGAAAAWLLSSAACYLCHAMAFLVLGLSCAVAALLAPPSRRLRAVLLVAAVGFGSLALLVGSGAGDGAWPGVRFVGAGAPYIPLGQPRPFQYRSPLLSLLYVPAFIANDATMGDAALWGLPLGAFLVAGWNRRREPTREPVRRERFVLPMVAAALLFLVPASSPNIDLLNAKFPAFLFLAIPSLVPARWLDRRAVATLAVFALASPAYALATHLRADRDMAGFDAVAARVPRGAHVLALVFEPGSDALLWVTPWLHVGCLLQAERGGRGYGLFWGPQIPVKERPDTIKGLWLLHDQPWTVASWLHLPLPDHVLTKGIGSRRVVLEGTYRVEAEEGDFTLFVRQPPSGGREPLPPGKPGGSADRPGLL